MSTQAETTDVPAGGRLPPGWRMSTIGELLKVRNGFAFKSTDYREEGALLIRQSNLDGSRVSIEKAKYLPKSYLDEYRDFLIKKGDILIGMSGSIGKLCAYDRDEPALQNQRTGLLVFKDPEQKPWVWHYLPLLEKDLLKAGKGVAVLNVSASQIESFPIPIAPLDQQKRIVAEIEKQFSRLDEAVANLKRVKANLKRYKAAVLKAAVEGRLVETEAELARREGRSYETGAQLLQRILETRRSQWKVKGKYKEPAAPDTTDLPELPEGWVWATVEQLNLANRPCAYGVLQPGEDLSDGVLFVRVGDINDGRVDTVALKRISPKIAAQYPRTKLAGGEFLITLVGAIGRTAVVPEVLAGANVARAVGVVPLSHNIDAHWIEIWFRNPAKVVEMTSKSHEVARKTLNLEDVRAASVAVPPHADQRRIVAEVDRRFSVIQEFEAQVSANLARAERLRQSILGAAFSGEFSNTSDNELKVAI